MRLERLNFNKIKVFLTFDDLHDRGLSKEDIWKDSIKWHQFFHDMLEEAASELGVEINGTVAVEVFSLQAQGMVLIVTLEHEIEDEDEEDHDLVVEMEFTMEGREDILFEFDGIDEVIELCFRLYPLGMVGGSLYFYHSKYFLFWDNIQSEGNPYFIPLLSEYGTPSVLTIHKIYEYGKVIMKDQCIEQLYKIFKKTNN